MATPTDRERTDPVVSGLDRGLQRRFDAALADGSLADLHGVVVVRDGRLVHEWYGSGEDFKWNESLGEIAFDADDLHDIRSVSKSVTSLLYGIALVAGLVPGPDEPILHRFPEYADLGADPLRARLTVEHALTMTLGLEWHEDLPYTSTANSEIAMEFAPDRYRYILERPIAEEPGQTWHYCGGATALLGRLIADGSRATLPEFARDRLFGPLGIERFEWMTGPDGVASPASGLRLRPRDLARIGQLVLDCGRWADRQVVPADWLETALRPHVTIGEGFDYGYQWYLGSFAYPDAGSGREPWFGGIGNGGQRLFVVPRLGLVTTIASGAYNAENQSAIPAEIMEMVHASVLS